MVCGETMGLMRRRRTRCSNRWMLFCLCLLFHSMTTISGWRNEWPVFW